MKKFKVFSIVILLCLLSSTITLAQGVDDNVNVFTSKNAKMYLQPLADAFGANLNSGFFHSAKIKKLGLSFELGIKMMLAPTPDEKRIFAMVEEEILGFTFTPFGGTKIPTIFGDKGEEEILGEGGITFPSPGGADINYFPLAVPQVTIGSVFGTELTIRYFPATKINDEVGEIKLSGWGLRHNVNQYIPFCPVDIAISYYNQSFSVGDIISASTNFYGAQASKKFSILTLYGGVGFEKSSLDISYTNDANKIEFKLDGDNSTRVTVGFALDLSILKIHADYNMGATNVIAAGIGLGI